MKDATTPGTECANWTAPVKGSILIKIGTPFEVASDNNVGGAPGISTISTALFVASTSSRTPPSGVEVTLR